jgi:molybdate transport system permease protein
MDLMPLFISVKLAFVSTCILLILSTPLAYLLARSSFAGKTFLEALINLPMVLPPTVIGFYLLLLLGQKGFVGRFWHHITGANLLFTFTGITIAAVVYSLPFALQPMKTAFEKIDRRLLENADVLGLSPVTAFFRVVIPNSVNGIAASAILVFAHTMGAFGVLLMVGGSIPSETRVASIAIYEAVQALNYREAGLLCLAILPVCYLFLLLINRLTRS